MKREAKSMVFVFVAAIAMIMMISAPNVAGNVIGDEQCYQITTNIDKAVEKKAEFSSTGIGKNPCTGLIDTRTSYRTYTKGITHLRTVFGNGDTKGNNGLTHYILCKDGRSKVVQWIASYYKRGIGWGHYYPEPFPHTDYKVIKCSTL
ncbi:hypothetical protein ACFLZZ_01140 [Nanoarchaeota archaeon]